MMHLLTSLLLQQLLQLPLEFNGWLMPGLLFMQAAGRHRKPFQLSHERRPLEEPRL